MTSPDKPTKSRSPYLLTIPRVIRCIGLVSRSAGMHESGLRAILSNWEFSSDPHTTIHKKSPALRGLFYGWRAWRDCAALPCAAPLRTANAVLRGRPSGVQNRNAHGWAGVAKCRDARERPPGDFVELPTARFVASLLKW